MTGAPGSAAPQRLQSLHERLARSSMRGHWEALGGELPELRPWVNPRRSSTFRSTFGATLFGATLGHMAGYGLDRWTCIPRPQGTACSAGLPLT